MFLIQGVFSQVQSGLGTSWESGDLQAVIRTALCFFVFHGIFGKDPDGEEAGEIHDHFGEAEVFNIRITETELCFDKRYKHRDYAIRYDLRKQPDGTWQGTYEGPQVGPGTARCVLVRVPDDFLAPPSEEIEKARAQFKRAGL